MTQQDLILVHGTWGHEDEWEHFADELAARGYRVHAPSLPKHGPPNKIDIWSTAGEVSKLGLRDYVADLKARVEEMETEPIIVGHSLGGLIAQLLAAEVPHRALWLMSTAPAAGVFAFYPKPLRLWSRYLPQIIGAKPMFPVSRKLWDTYIGNATRTEDNDFYYSDLCAESGRVYREMVLWPLDRKQASRVDYDRISGPVLLLVGAQDRCTVPGMSRATAKRFGSKARLVELPGCDHLLISKTHSESTLAEFDMWAVEQGFAPKVDGRDVGATAGR